VRPLSERHACRVVGQHRSTQPRPAPPNPYRDRLVARMRELAIENPRRGRQYVMDLLHKEGWSIGTRRMKRLWRTEGLLVPQKRVKRRRIGTGENGIVRRRATMKNEVWGMDFIQDRTADGRPLRLLVVLDEHTGEFLALEVRRTFRGEDIVMVLDELTAIRGTPEHIRSDNGPELVSKAVKAWCEESGTGALYINPGSPWQNGIVESFNGRLRDELLSSEIFDTLAEARYLADRRRLHDNHRRPQRALGKQTPATPALRHRRAGRELIPCTDSHSGWTNESDPVSLARDFRGGRPPFICSAVPVVLVVIRAYPRTCLSRMMEHPRWRKPWKSMVDFS
jgi:transposase InsO family protein